MTSTTASTTSSTGSGDAASGTGDGHPDRCRRRPGRRGGIGGETRPAAQAAGRGGSGDRQEQAAGARLQLVQLCRHQPEGPRGRRPVDGRRGAGGHLADGAGPRADRRRRAADEEPASGRPRPSTRRWRASARSWRPAGRYSPSGHRPRDVRDRIVAQVLGVPAPGLASADASRPCWSPATWRRPTPRRSTSTTSSRSSPSWADRPATPRSSPPQLNLPCRGPGRRRDAARRTTDLAVDAAAGTVTVDPDHAMREAIIARAKARAALKTATGGPGKTQDGHHVELLANVGDPADAAPAAAAGARASGCSGPSSGSSTATRRRASTSRSPPTAACWPPSPVARWSSARSTRAPTSPCRSSPGDAEVNPALGVRGLRTATRAPGGARRPATAIARAAAAERRRLGDGADGLDGRRGPAVRRRVHRARAARRRRDDRGAQRGPARVRS